MLLFFNLIFLLLFTSVGKEGEIPRVGFTTWIITLAPRRGSVRPWTPYEHSSSGNDNTTTYRTPLCNNCNRGFTSRSVKSLFINFVTFAEQKVPKPYSANEPTTFHVFDVGVLFFPSAVCQRSRTQRSARTFACRMGWVRHWCCWFAPPCIVA